jgi:Actin like proteins N terminal domain
MENHVTIAVDPGASGIKVVCSVNGNDPYAFLIPPYIIEYDEPKKLIRDVNFDKDNLWVKMGKNYYAVGSLAERSGAAQLIKPQKFITAPSKICAAIGIAMQTLKISSEFTLSLNCVLPPAELGDAEIIIKNIRSAVNNLEYPSGKTKINLKSFNIYPEGYGILNAQGFDLKEYDSIVTIMMGYRNISMFETKRGYPERPYTELIGFHDYLFDIASETSIKVQDLIEPVCAVARLSEDDLKYYNRQSEIYDYKREQIKTKIISEEESGTNYEVEGCRSELEYLEKCVIEQSLIISDFTKNYEQRFHHLINGEGNDRDYMDTKIKQVQANKYKKYVKKMKDWFSERLPARTQIICIAGGTAKYLGEDIYSFLAQKGEVRKGIAIPFVLDSCSEIETGYRGKISSSTMKWDSDFAKEMEMYKNRYDYPLSVDEKQMATHLERFEDIYGLFRHVESISN